MKIQRQDEMCAENNRQHSHKTYSLSTLSQKSETVSQTSNYTAGDAAENAVGVRSFIIQRPTPIQQSTAAHQGNDINR